MLPCRAQGRWPGPRCDRALAVRPGRALPDPAGLRRLDFATFIYVQYFDGYAESIRGYTHYSQSLRAGLSLVR